MSGPGARHLALAILLATVPVSTSALAEPTPADRAEAHTLFEGAREAMKNRDYAVACPKLEESQRLVPGIGVLYNVGSCYEGMGRLVKAWRTFAEVAEAAERAGQADRATAARGRAAAVEQRLAHLKVTTEGPDRRTLTLDGAPFEPSPGDAGVPIDPGDHELAADAPGKVHWATHVDAKEGSTLVVTVPSLEDASVAPPSPVAMPAATPIEPPVEPRAKSGPAAPAGTWHTAAAIVAGALGVVGIGVGTGLGGMAIDKWSDAKAMGCMPNAAGQAACPSSPAYSTWSTAHGVGIASTATILVGGALVATGAVVWLTRPNARVKLGVRSDGLAVMEGRFP